MTTIRFGRLAVAGSRINVRGMTKEETISRIRENTKIAFGIDVSRKFLSKFTQPQLYELMRAAYGKHWHWILTQWKAENVQA